MAIKIRAILDVEKDVIRDLIIDDSSNLELVHKELAKAFGFNGQEMASFYLSDSEWNQGEEYPLFDMGTSKPMKDTLASEVFQSKSSRLIYVYDFFSMWTFFIEVIDTKATTKNDLPFVSFAFGETPDEAPEKEFTAENTSLDFDMGDDEMDGFGEFENLDDYDF
ncbi:MAG: hypothetical protein BM563_07900 [Bacteroidetes bacterium MedPE-SWsnd-G1]|nr:MAG: hypothetical protein BM563_07900 [Bacteroidetes bacterium MedPE-SWsnd-G1]